MQPRPHVARTTAADEIRDYYALNRRVYAKLARFYDVVATPIAGLRDHVAQLAAMGPGSRVLDVATGTGEQAIAFAKMGARVDGIDLSEAMLEMARKKALPENLRLRVADATDLPFADDEFDACCVSFALHEMPPTIRRQVVREMARVTRQGGAVIVVDYAVPRNAWAARLVIGLVSLYERDHYAEFVRSDLRALLEGEGIEVDAQERRRLGNVQIVCGRKRSLPG